MMRINNQLILKIFSISSLLIGFSFFIYFFLTAGLGTDIIYLYIGVFFITITMLTSKIIVDRYSNEYFFLLMLYLTTVILFSMRKIRFNGLDGQDILREHNSARTTLETLSWDIGRTNSERYFPSVSASLTPAIISLISGIDILKFYIYFPPIISSLLPILIYYIIKSVFKNINIASNTSIFYSQFYYHASFLQNLYRQQIAELFLLIGLYSLFKQNKYSDLRYYIMFILSMIGIILSHNTVNYFSLAIYSIIYFMDKIKTHLPIIKKYFNLDKITDHNFLSIKSMFFIFSLSFLWMNTLGFTNFERDVGLSIYRIFTPLADYRLEFVRSSPAGFIITTWFNLMNILILIGFLYIFIFYKKDDLLYSWLSGSGIMFFFMFFWMFIIPSLGVSIERIYVLGFPFFISYIGFIIYKLNQRKYMKIFSIIFLLLYLPMNMLLPAHHKYAYFHPESEIPVEINVSHEVSRYSQFNMAVWTDDYVDENRIIITDFVAISNIFPTHAHFFSLRDPELAERIFGRNHYFALDHFNYYHNFWKSSDLDFVKISLIEYIMQDYYIYNNGKASLLYRPIN